MKLKDLKAHEIIIFALGERGVLKSNKELANILKKKLTKKERYALNAKVSNADMRQILKKLNVNKERFDAIITKAIKKMKNERLHKEFYLFK